jgi:hypothetical protein
MKSIITAVAAAFLAASLTIPADAAGSKKKDTTAMNSKAASCKAEAKKKYTAMHPLKRRAFEKKCMGTA